MELDPMTVDFFEGPAGTGKTHNMVLRARDAVNDNILGDRARILALTFMNGARRRLHARLGEYPAFRGRFECQTFDVFARSLRARRRSLVLTNAALIDVASRLSEFDGPCFLASKLLEEACVSRWVATSYPLVLVDEAQDLDGHRFNILKALSNACHIVAAADAFQCLEDGHDTGPVMDWLATAGQTIRLTQSRRTTRSGLLGVAGALRSGLDIRGVLSRSGGQRAIWNGGGFRLLECPATNSGIVARNIAEQLVGRSGQVAILTPDAQNTRIRDAISAVCSRTWNWRNGSTFGPYQCQWELPDRSIGDTLLAQIGLPDLLDFSAAIAALRPHSHESTIAQVIKRLDHVRRTRGQNAFPKDDIAAILHEAVRNQSRLGLRRDARYPVMTIQRAKNREFPNVIVLWPYSATGSPEHLRRMLYNAVTRATTHCSVIVLGQGRLNGVPFSAAS
jgi:hypothetical protein